MTHKALLYRKNENGRNIIKGVFKSLDIFFRRLRVELPFDLNPIKSVCNLMWFYQRLKTNNIHIAIFLFWKKIIITVHDCNHYEDLSGIRKKMMGLIWYTLPPRIANKVTVIPPFAEEQLCEYFSFNNKDNPPILNGIYLLELF